MHKQQTEELFPKILDALALFPEGASLKQIWSSLELSINQRTLQRRLAELVKQGRVIVIGQSRARRYCLPTQLDQQSVTERKENLESQSLALCTEAATINALVSKPVHMRKYVNYNRAFLDSYQPNISAYLPLSVREHLGAIGKTDGTRPLGTYARLIFNRLLIDLSWNSSRLEGNTYSLLETERLIQLQEKPEGKNLQETQMILNHKAAIEFLVEFVDEIAINQFTILNLHALLSNNLLGNQEACGRIRDIPIGIARAVYQPTAIIQLIEECFQTILNKGAAIENPFEQAFFLMIHLPYLQPFEDVNKRTSRIAANIPFFKQNLCPLSFIDVPQDLYINGLLGIYELNKIDLMRDIFIWAYERSCAFYSTTKHAVGEPDPFRIKYRDQIYTMVVEIVANARNKKEAINAIQKYAASKISTTDQSAFVAAVEMELRALHMGNIARYHLRPKEFNTWHSVWVAG